MKNLIFYLVVLLLTSCAKETGFRNTISLNGTWQVAEGSKDVIPKDFNHTVMVPGLLNMAEPAFKDVGPHVKDRKSLIQTDSLREAFWYKRTFKADDIPAIAKLKVSKAMWGTKVYLNGKDMGEHLPCFTPGYFDLKSAIRKGKNELVIRIGSARNSVPLSIPDGFDFEKVRYIPGIYDDVELILSGTPDILNVQTAPDLAGKQVKVRLTLGNAGEAVKSRVSVIVSEYKSGSKSGELIQEVDLPAGSKDNTVDLAVPIENCRFWSPEDPFLYNLEVKTEGDSTATRFGMREFRLDTITGMTTLNGKPYFMRGSNITIYRFFEDSLCSDLPWNEEWVRKLHRSFKDFHWNGLRYCIGFPPEMWYKVADEEGFLIQDEFPIWYGGKGWNVWPEALKADELAKEFSEWMHERWNHPSVVIWDGSNENVSNNLQTEEIADAIKRVRSLDMSNRPWDNSYSLVRETGDVVECHPYHFIKNTYKLRDIATAINDPVVHHQYIWPDVRPNDNRYIKIINEYAWLWLNRDGKPTTLTTKLYKNLLGADSTIENRRHLYATYLAAETEFWRCHRKANAVLHFTALAYSRDDGNTSDHFTDVKNLVYEEEFLKYMPDAFSPVGLMLDEWGIEIPVNKSHQYKIVAINDLEPEWMGSVKLQIIDKQEVIAEKTTDLVISPFGQANASISLKGPQKPGIYTVIATLEKTGEKPVRSVREVPFI